MLARLKPVIVIRSLLFNLWFYGVTLVIAVISLPLVLGPGHWSMALARVWVRITHAGLRPLCGIRTEIRGLEHVPDGPVIYASKHQSAWETMAFVALCHHPVYVQKKELRRIPLFGTYTHKAGMISIDRGAGRKAVEQLVAEARDRIAQGRSIVIFPQGTRVAPGAYKPYKSGIAALYEELSVPVIPVALNSGCFWGRNAFLKKPGTIVMEFLPAMEPGLSRDAFMAALEERIEGASAQLMG